MDELYFTKEEIPIYEGTYSSSAHFDYSLCHKDKDKVYISEGIDYEPDANEKGDIIVFSTDVNALRLNDNGVLNYLKQKLKSITNRITKKNKKLDTIANKHNLIGWIVGNFLHGRHKGKNGKIYDEKSTSIEIIGVDIDTLISIEIIGVDIDTLISIAEELCVEFLQENVLVKDYSSGRVFFVNTN